MTDLHKAVFLSYASEAFAWRGRVVDTHDGGLTNCTHDPILAPLYGDPSFSELKTKLGRPH